MIKKEKKCHPKPRRGGVKKVPKKFLVKFEWALKHLATSLKNIYFSM
jgi:hypothetical protein